ncbi:MAG: hypothetical protein J4203_01175 [Candidatus Diapherotrites archaeon]|uniref:Uncharacterized protein n=1 Tax=Candidatus Iainarchaeum sp. TaxID=3101447 RepID=A0A8T4LA72_9ARCH|nr:hypothetical protein [Candidatus Diapherotrites archaeon]
MLLRFLSHLVGLDLPWVANDLLLDFLAMAAFSFFFFWIFDDYKGFRSGLYRFTMVFLFLWAVLDVLQLMGWKPLTHSFTLEFFVFQLGIGTLLAGTRLHKHTTVIILMVFFIGSWLVT